MNNEVIIKDLLQFYQVRYRKITGCKMQISTGGFDYKMHD